TNSSQYDLRDCEFPPGFSPRRVEMFTRGTHVQAVGHADGEAPVIACTFDGSPLDLADARAGVVTQGRTMSVHHLTTRCAARHASCSPIMGRVSFATSCSLSSVRSASRLWVPPRSLGRCCGVSSLCLSDPRLVASKLKGSTPRSTRVERDGI